MSQDNTRVQLANLKKHRRNDSYTINNSCERPFKSVTIDADGECFLCICDAWLPISAGNISSFDSLDEIWNNPQAKSIQQDILDKTYKNCAVEKCGILDRNITQPEYRINYCPDNSCNLACPSCRKEMINYTSGKVFDSRADKVNHFLNLLKKFDKPLSIILIGNGDPLASLIMRPLVLNWKPKEKQKITLFTNGLLLKKLLPDSPVLPFISEFQISVDAGTKEIYENVRRPGKFETLTTNLDWLVTNLPAMSTVTLKFTISAGNASDITNFAKLCKQYGFNGDITNLTNWYTFDDFNSQEVVDNTAHELHSVVVEQLRAVSTLSYILMAPDLRKLI
jgi:MoaA/NifB/PqqE/SkfB family radical SAM enzyme